MVEENVVDWFGKTCKVMNKNMFVKHPRLHTVMFDDIVREPLRSFQLLFDAIGLPFGAVQREILEETFNNQNCQEDEMTTCKNNSTESIAKWRYELSSEEVTEFDKNVDCQKLSAFYGQNNNGSSWTVLF